MIIYRFFKNLILNIKYTKIIKRVYKDEQLIEKFSKLFGTEFRIDWVGRVYAVINPNVLNTETDISTQIFEYDEKGFNNYAYIEKWIMDKLNAVKDYIMANNLFDLLTYEIKKLDEYNNYLFVIKPITFDDCIKSTKTFSIVYGIITVIAIISFVVFKFFI